MAKHGKLWLAAWQHLATSGNIWQHGLQHVTILLRWFPKGTAWCSPVPNKAWDLACRHRLWIMERMERMEVEPWSRAGAVTNWDYYLLWREDKEAEVLSLHLSQDNCSFPFSWHFMAWRWSFNRSTESTAAKFGHWESLGNHWNRCCLRLGLSDQCPGRTDRPMSHQCCDTVERNKIPLIDLYLCKPCRLARVIENNAYPKRGFEWFWRFQVCQNNVWMIIEWSLNEHWMISMSHMSITFQENHR